MRILLLLLITSLSLQAQVKPTPVEFLFGNNKLQGQTTLIKNFGQSKFGIFSLLTIATPYKVLDKSSQELFSNMQLNYDVYKGLKVTAGATFNSAKGFAPIAGLEYVYNNKLLTLVVNPTVNLTKERVVANYSHLEYAPKNDKLNFYGRLQGLYVNNFTLQQHERSSLVLRAGISLKGFATGLGMNREVYGPTKVAKPNYGVFLHYKFM